MLFLYSWLMRLATPLLRLKLQRRAKHEPLYAHRISERLGYYLAGQDTAADVNRPLIWLHAVSLGETKAAAILLAELRQAVPAMRLLLTHSTATGWAEGQKLVQPDDVQTWLPWDSAAAVKRFYAAFQPRIGILMETEIWPTLLLEAQNLAIPVVLANARLRERSRQGFAKLPSLFGPCFASLSAVYAQSEGDAKRLQSVGAKRVQVVGNLKFDAEPDAEQVSLGQSLRSQIERPVLMLASSREGEEQMWLACLQAKQRDADRPRVQYLIVPRHPQRFDVVQKLFQDAGFSVSRRSRWQPQAAPADIWLGDSMGEMAFYYALSDAVLMGGSFAPHGGQNLIEATACGCSVWVGPHTYNFTEAVSLGVAAGVVHECADMQSAWDASLRFLESDATTRQAARARALVYSRSHIGAAKRTVQAIVSQHQAALLVR